MTFSRMGIWRVVRLRVIMLVLIVVKICQNVDLNTVKTNAYIGHRRWLPHDHPFRTQKQPFNNKYEREPPPKPLNSEAIFRKVESIENKWGKVKDKKARKRMMMTIVFGGRKNQYSLS